MLQVVYKLQNKNYHFFYIVLRNLEMYLLYTQKG